VTPRRWVEYLIAILAGNGSTSRSSTSLPPALQHKPFGFDLGLLIDFVCCVLVYAAIRLGTRHAHRAGSGGG
jgi:hypothetical protein